MADFIITPTGRRIACQTTDGSGPAVVFLPGFRSDMNGTKALWLEDWTRSRRHAFVRFDYSGHGQSDGRFEDGCISDWAADAAAVIQLVNGPVILVGSSMGGWISLLLAREGNLAVAGLVTIAAAPDFTEDSMWAGFDTATRRRLVRDGLVHLPSEYGEPYAITRRLIEDGRASCVLRDPLHMPFPVRFLQGTADKDVPMEVALRLLGHVTGPDIRLTMVKDADHRFSTPDCVDLIGQVLGDVIERTRHRHTA